MSSEGAYAAAATLKESVLRDRLEQDNADTVSDDPPPHQDEAAWYVQHEGSPLSRLVSYDVIAERADKEYERWRRLKGVSLQHTKSLEDGLVKFVQETPVEELARILDRVPSGLVPHPRTGVTYDFLPWQRLCIAHWQSHLFDVTSRIVLSGEAMREMTRESQRSGMRKLPIKVEYSVIKGSCPDHFIFDLPTAAGKTAIVLAAGASLLLNPCFGDLLTERLQKRKGVCVAGPPTTNAARMMIVACPGSVFDHFVTTARRLAPRMEDMQGGVKVEVWDKTGKEFSTTAALRLPHDRILIWIVPVLKLNEILRKDPTVSVPVVVTDEYTVSTPRERWCTEQSPVWKQIIAKATPQDLVMATMGNRSWLRDLMGGELIPPCRFSAHVRTHEWKLATLCASQAARLDVMTLTPFRRHVRDELKHLVPPGLLLTFVKCRRLTVAAFVEDARADMLPSNLFNVLMSKLKGFYVQESSVKLLHETLSSGETVSPKQIADVVSEMQVLVPPRSEGYLERFQDAVKVVSTRILEFDNECPICKNEDMQTKDMKMYGCCGYCVCSECWSQIRSRVCPFCRTPVSAGVPKEDMQASVPSELVDEYPTASVVGMVNSYPTTPTPLSNIASLLRNDMITNLTHTMHHLKQNGYVRTLVVVEKSEHAMRTHDVSHTLDIDQLSLVTGFQIHRVDDLLGSRGARFTAIKNEFDVIGSDPTALLCYGQANSFLVGTDLVSTDSLVVVGSIPNRLMTQACARILRPNALRDNTKPILQVRISV